MDEMIEERCQISLDEKTGKIPAMFPIRWKDLEDASDFELVIETKPLYERPLLQIKYREYLEEASGFEWVIVRKPWYERRHWEKEDSYLELRSKPISSWGLFGSKPSWGLEGDRKSLLRFPKKLGQHQTKEKDNVSHCPASARVLDPSPHTDMIFNTYLLQGSDDQQISVPPIPNAHLTEVPAKEISDQPFSSESNGDVHLDIKETDAANNNIVMENQQAAADLNVSSNNVVCIDSNPETVDAGHIGNQQPPAVLNVSSSHVVSITSPETEDAAHINPEPEDAAHIGNQEEDNNLEQKLSEPVATYDKYGKEIYKLITLEALTHAPVLTAIFSAQQKNGRVMMSEKLILSVIVSGGVMIALLRIFFLQFRLLKRVRLVMIEDGNSRRDRCPRERIEMRSMRHSSASRFSLFVAEQVDLLDFWWPAQRAAFLVIFVGFLTCLWRC